MYGRASNVIVSFIPVSLFGEVVMNPPNLVQDSFKYHILLMKLLGLYPLDNFPRLFPLYAYFCYFCFTIPFPPLATIKLIVLKEKDMSKICDSLSLILEVGVMVLKLLPFKRTPYKITRSIFYLDNPVFNKNIQEQEYIIRGTVTTCRRIFLIFLCSCMTSLTTWSLKVFFYQERTLPTDVWLPFDPISDVRIYLTVFLFTFLGVGNAALGTASIDTLMAGLINHAAGQIKLLKDTLQHLARRTESKLNKYKHLPSDEREKLKSKMIYGEICECVEHYDAIFDFVKYFEKTYSSIIFVQFAASVLVICISCLQIILVEPFSATFFAMVSYILTMLAEIFLYCYYGTILYEEVSK
ncbi:hypothetical protein JTB14_033427 [Gonioctena quinquepunctata]|nr:hypothetical protein JTB14_033427 [Gonioctena quinquepunctata]